jgi:hypothetical protein
MEWMQLPTGAGCCEAVAHAMKPSSDHLEHLVHQLLRGLSDRTAPRDFPAHVLHAARVHAARPWWTKPFTQWPPAMKMIFVVASAITVIATVIFLTGQIDLAQIGAGLAGRLAWIGDLEIALAGVASFCIAAMRMAPAAWWYTGLIFVGVLYAALFGLSAAAYRALLSPQHRFTS